MDIGQYSDDLFEERSLLSTSQEKKRGETERKSILKLGAYVKNQDSDHQDNQKDKV